MTIPPTIKIVEALLLAASAAVGSLILLTFVGLSFGNVSGNPPWKLALGIGYFGALYVFPVTVIGGVTSYSVAKSLGVLNRAAAFGTASVLSLVIPLWVAVDNAHQSSAVGAREYIVCLVCGLVGAWVFCRVMGITKWWSHGQTQP